MLARLLLPAEFGKVAMVGPVLAFVAAFNDMGYSQIIIQRKTLTQQEVNSLFWLNLGLSGILSLGIILLSPVIGLVYRDDSIQPLLISLAPTLILTTLSSIPLSLLARQIRFTTYNIIEVVGIGAGIGATIAFAISGFSYWALILGQLSTSIVTAALAFSFAGWRPRKPAIAPGTREMAKFGANLTGTNLAGYLSMMADRIIIGAVAGSGPLGLYDRSYALVVSPLSQLLMPLNRIALPLLSRVREDVAMYRRTYIQLLKASLILGTPAMLFCSVLAHPFVLFLWGDRWTKAADILVWFAIGGIPAPFFLTAAWLFVSEGRFSLQLKLSIATAAISVASFAIGITWGAAGVARTNCLSFFFLQIPLMVWGVARGGIVTLGDFGRVLKALLPPTLVTLAFLLIASRYQVAGWMTVAALLTSYAVFCATVVSMPSNSDVVAIPKRLIESALARLR